MPVEAAHQSRRQAVTKPLERFRPVCCRKPPVIFNHLLTCWQAFRQDLPGHLFHKETPLRINRAVPQIVGQNAPQRPPPRRSPRCCVCINAIIAPHNSAVPDPRVFKIDSLRIVAKHSEGIAASLHQSQAVRAGDLAGQNPDGCLDWPRWGRNNSYGPRRPRHRKQKPSWIGFPSEGACRRSTPKSTGIIQPGSPRQQSAKHMEGCRWSQSTARCTEPFPCPRASFPSICLASTYLSSQLPMNKTAFRWNALRKAQFPLAVVPLRPRIPDNRLLDPRQNRCAHVAPHRV